MYIEQRTYIRICVMVTNICSIGYNYIGLILPLNVIMCVIKV